LVVVLGCKLRQRMDIRNCDSGVVRRLHLRRAFPYQDSGSRNHEPLRLQAPKHRRRRVK
jgi:hypothetical protein